MKLIDETGRKYGCLRVLRRTEPPGQIMARSAATSAWWLCECDCGRQRPVMGHSLRSSNNVRCCASCTVGDRGKRRKEE
jgi:hypothetical protein